MNLSGTATKYFNFQRGQTALLDLKLKILAEKIMEAFKYPDSAAVARYQHRNTKGNFYSSLVQ